MSTVAELIDRCYRDFLMPSDDQGVIVTVVGAVTAGATEIVYDDSTLAPDEEALLAPGVLAEIGTELVRITDVDVTTNMVTVLRGVNGTDADAIADGAEMHLAPAFPRRSVFDAICDSVVELYPDLFQVGTETVTSASGAVDVSADIVSVRSVTWTSGTRPVTGQVELLRNYTPSATGQAVLFHGVPAGKTVYLVYEGRFARPASEDVEVSTLGVDPTWERIVTVGAAAQVLAGRDVDSVSSEYLTEQLEREGFPVGSAQRIRDGLLRYHGFLLDRARRNQRADRTVPVVMNL